MKYTSKSEADTRKIAAEFAGILKKGDTVALFGDLGAGKTAFAKGLIYALTNGKYDAGSPTFVVVNQYESDYTIYHFDMYRITVDGLCDIGYYDYIDSDAICIIEWSENIESELPQSRYEVKIKSTGEESREISICKIQNNQI